MATVHRVRRFMLDSNALDPIVSEPGAYEALRAEIDSGRVLLLYTHISVEEIAAVPDLERRVRLLLLLIGLGQLVPTGAFVLGVSRLSWARLFDDEEAFEALRSGNVDHSRDALIATTAIYENCALVTNDQRLAKRARERGLEVLSTSELLEDCGFSAAAPAAGK